jgi:hypothetical protein
MYEWKEIRTERKWITVHIRPLGIDNSRLYISDGVWDGETIPGIKEKNIVFGE